MDLEKSSVLVEGRSQCCFLNSARAAVNSNHNSTFATWYNDKGRATCNYTFGELWKEAGVIAHRLRREWKLNKGDHVVLCYNFNLHFFASYLGCLRAGVVAVLVYPPVLPLVSSLPKITGVVNDCAARLILCDRDVLFLQQIDSSNILSKSRHLWPPSTLFKVTTTGRSFRLNFGQRLLACLCGSPKTETTNPSTSFDEFSLTDDDVAFLQYTSGSTSTPKGVMITFRNLAANVKLTLEGTQQFFRDDAQLEGKIPKRFIGFSWLPQYHDMGLVTATVAPFIGGWRQHYMSPLSFIKNPLLWLQLMSRHEVMMSVAPDFAYRLVARKFVEARKHNTAECPIPGLDLSSVCCLSNAAEPVRPDTHKIFWGLFAQYGLREGYNHIAYGLAEHVVVVSWHQGFHRPSLPEFGTTSGAIGSRKSFHDSITVKIVDPTTLAEVEDGQEGEIWVSSPCVAKGYHGQPQESQAIFRAQCQGISDLTFLRTGDLGFFADDHMFICGRIKDLIIFNGKNYYPQDVEAAAMDASRAVRQGCVAAFSKDETRNDGELEIVFEIRKEHEDEAGQVIDLVQSAVRESSGLAPARVVAIKERSIPKTTSGKIQRRATRIQLHSNSLNVVRESVAVSSLPLPTKQQVDLVPSAKRSPNDIEAPLEPKDHVARFHQIVATFVGGTGVQDTCWDELGLSSISLAQLQSAITDELSVVLEPDAFEIYSTPSLLAQHVLARLQSRDSLVVIQLPSLPQTKCTTLPIHLVDFLQALGVVANLFLFALPIIPAYEAMSWFAAMENTGKVSTIAGGRVQWLLFPFAVPIWMLSFSLLVVATKWIVVGRYQAQEVPINSLAFLRWWFVDRLVHIWEFWVGRFIKNTFLLGTLYRLLGATIHFTGKIDEHIREFDLVEIGKGTSIEHQVRCRKFSPWKSGSDSLPLLRFRPIKVESGAVVRGMLSPGAVVGEGAQVDPVSVVPEGGQIPPAANSNGVDEETGLSKSAMALILIEVLKLFWCLLELYLFFTLLFVANILSGGCFPAEWRYTLLANWVLSIAIATVLNMLVGVGLKWALIGRKVPGPFKATIWGELADFAVDFHFNLSIALPNAFFTASVFWNLLLKLYGMDIDMSSAVSAQCFPPSKLDLITVRESFLSKVSFEIKKDGRYLHSNVCASSVGLHVTLGPGVSLQNVIVRPGLYITQDVKKQACTDERYRRAKDLWLSPRWFGHQAALHFLFVAYLGLFLASLLPAYELWTLVFDPSSVNQAVVAFSVALAVTTASFLLVFRGFQAITYFKMTNSETDSELASPWSLPLHVVCLNMCFAISVWSFLPLLWGTPYFGWVARFLGANVKGRFLYFGERLFDFPFLIIEAHTILDGVLAGGHHMVFGEMMIGDNQLSGLHHERTMTFANSSSTAKEESGPWRAVF